MHLYYLGLFPIVSTIIFFLWLFWEEISWEGFIKVIIILFWIFSITIGLIWFILGLFSSANAQTTITASVEKSAYYQCVDECEYLIK